MAEKDKKDEISLRILVTGIGGQGAIRATQILGWAAINQGYKVRTAETHGMAQRGGSVKCYLGIGNVNGVLFPKGMADIVLAFEEIEAMRCLEFANENTVFLTSKTQAVPPGLYFKNIEYPSEEDIIDTIKKVSKKAFVIDAKKIAIDSGEPRAENVVMLAYLFATGLLPFEKEIFEKTVYSFIPKKAIEPNKIAFNTALKMAKENKDLMEQFNKA